MNKLGIWAIVISGAFLIGVLSANPVVEAVGGWQGAFDVLNSKTIKVIRFDGGAPSPFTNNEVYIIDHTDASFNAGVLRDFEIASTMVGVNGAITKFHYQTGRIDTNVNGITITATLYKNAQPTSFTCSIVTGISNICEVEGFLEVVETDRIAVTDISINSNPDVFGRHAYVIISP